MHHQLTYLVAAAITLQAWLMARTCENALATLQSALVLRMQLQGREPLTIASTFCAEHSSSRRQPLCTLDLQLRAGNGWQSACITSPSGRAARYWRIALSCHLLTWQGTYPFSVPNFIELLD